jgi:hypothetical protein
MNTTMSIIEINEVLRTIQKDKSDLHLCHKRWNAISFNKKIVLADEYLSANNGDINKATQSLNELLNTLSDVDFVNWLQSK